MRNTSLKLLHEHPSAEELIQQYIEGNPGFLIHSHELHHGVLWEAIVSKFRLDTSLTTDFMFITGTSAEWRVVLVEIELPSNRLYVGDGTRTRRSADLSKGIGQIDSWRCFIDEHHQEVANRVRPLLLRDLPIEFRYVLVIGRSAELDSNPTKLKMWRNETGRNGDLRVHTFDTLARWYAREGYRNREHNVLAERQRRFEFKHLRSYPSGMLSYLKPHQLNLSTAHKEQLREWGYDVDRWLRGERVHDPEGLLQGLARGPDNGI